MELRLRALEVRSPWRWRWLLVDEDEAPLADHNVSLDGSSAEAEAFQDAYQYVRWNADQADRTESEASLVRWIGEFIGAQALGPSIGRVIADYAPVTVRVEVPPEAEWLAFRPWELAYVDGKPLAAHQGVVLLYDLPGTRAGRKQPVVGALRMLALFSLPTEASARGLRRERYELTRLVRRVSARSNRQIELAVAQYGVTRDRLSELAETGDGWDILHMSGHGSAGEFLLETEAGATDPVSTEQLTRLLRPARRRLKLVVISACQSAAATTAETLRWVGLDEQAQRLEAQADTESRQSTAAQSGLANAVVHDLDCAAVAMRFPVVDGFAVSFASEFYTRLFERRQTVDRAFSESVAAAAGPAPTADRPALSIGTPALFGESAVGLSLVPPAGRPLLDPAQVRMAYFPAEPERFVGQGRIMAAGSRTLAPFSGRAGILLVGPAGAGKTACALELAYRYEGSFAASAFWQAPTREEEWAGALADFAARLDIQLRGYGFTMASHISTAADLEAFLPRLRQLLRDQGLLLVLDNLESLLTSDGEWRDPRWATLMEALTTHHGESRVILTSRVGIATVNSRLVEEHRVSALSSGESVLLARELPYLATLLRTSSPAREADSGLNPAELARRVITMAQGSPRLLELADATAADPALLARALDQNADSSPGAALGATPTDGGGLDTAQLSVALGAWTASAVANLPEPSLLLLRMLCRLEDADRQPSVVESNWSDLWRRLELPGGPPPLADASAPLERTALTQAEPDDNGDESRPGTYLIHPGLAKEIRDTTPTEVSAAVDTEMAAYWISAFRYLSDQARNGQPSSELARRAAISAAAYLSRLQDWRSATQLLSAVLDMDHSTATAQALIPSLRRVAESSGQSTATLLLADALTETDAREAEALLRGSYDSAVANQDHRLASAVAGRLVVVLVSAGRLVEALELCGEKVSHSRQAGLDPWSVLADEARTTEILSQMGRHGETLSQVQSLRGKMAELPSAPADFDGPEPWRVREKILRIGQESAQAVRDWRLALEINAEIAESEQWRGAPASLLADTQFNSWWPLAQTGRLDEAEQSLLGCQQTFEENGDIDALARVLRARANLAARHDLFDQAVALAQASIRLCYQRPDPAVVATCHDQLATYLSQASVPRKRLAQRAHRLAAALLLEIIGEAYRLTEIIKSLAADMKDTPDSSVVDMPSTLESIDNLCAETDGVEFATLLSSIQPDARSVQETVDQILASAGDLGSRDTVADIVAQWEPVVAAVATAVTTEHTPAELDALLDDLGGTKDWASLVSALRRVLAGERGRDRLEAGLDEIDTAILAATLERLPGPR